MGFALFASGRRRPTPPQCGRALTPLASAGDAVLRQQQEQNLGHFRQPEQCQAVHTGMQSGMCRSSCTFCSASGDVDASPN